MKTEVVNYEIKDLANEFGVNESKATELTGGLSLVIKERKPLIEEFEEVSKLEITNENIPLFKALRNKIVKHRTQGINKWHTKNKEFFLAGGKFVDAIKRKEVAINEAMEEKLKEAENYFDNLEKERLAKLQSERVALISEYLEGADERDLSNMDDDVWETFLSTKKKAHFDKIEAEKQEEILRESERIEREKENERIRKENEVLRKKAEEKERLDKIEREKKEQERIETEKKQNAERLRIEKLEAEIEAKKEAERKEEAEREAKVQAELSKGDSDKINDLILDLQSLKEKYHFKSESNVKMIENVKILIDKTINYIKENKS